MKTMLIFVVLLLSTTLHSQSLLKNASFERDSAWNKKKNGFYDYKTHLELFLVNWSILPGKIGKKVFHYTAQSENEFVSDGNGSIILNLGTPAGYSDCPLIFTELRTVLEKGKEYTIKMMLRRNPSGELAVNRIRIAFVKDRTELKDRSKYLFSENSDSLKIKECDHAFQELSFQYKATGTEKFLILGDHYRDGSNLCIYGKEVATNLFASYFIDNIRILQK